jgi:Uma2 family endonuclease
VAKAAQREDWPRTVAEFEEWHARQPERWEFIDGRPRLMAPGSLNHTIIKTNIGTALKSALTECSCTTFVDGAQIVADEISAIPNVVVTCGSLDHTTAVVAEPTIVVEVMSPKSEADDTGRKWQAYQKIPSLKHYILLSQDQRLVNVHSRTGDLWREHFLSAGMIELDDPPVRLAIDDLYGATDLAA